MVKQAARRGRGDFSSVRVTSELGTMIGIVAKRRGLPASAYLESIARPIVIRDYTATLEQAQRELAAGKN